MEDPVRGSAQQVGWSPMQLADVEGRELHWLGAMGRLPVRERLHRHGRRGTLMPAGMWRRGDGDQLSLDMSGGQKGLGKGAAMGLDSRGYGNVEEGVKGFECGEMEGGAAYNDSGGGLKKQVGCVDPERVFAIAMAKVNGRYGREGGGREWVKGDGIFGFLFFLVFVHSTHRPGIAVPPGTMHLLYLLKIMEYLFELIQSSHTFVVLVLLIFEGICNTVTVQKQFYGFEISQTLHTWRFLVNW